MTDFYSFNIQNIDNSFVNNYLIFIFIYRDKWILSVTKKLFVYNCYFYFYEIIILVCKYVSKLLWIHFSNRKLGAGGTMKSFLFVFFSSFHKQMWNWIKGLVNSVKFRSANAYYYLFFFTKNCVYYYDLYHFFKIVNFWYFRLDHNKLNFKSIILYLVIFNNTSYNYTFTWCIFITLWPTTSFNIYSISAVNIMYFIDLTHNCCKDLSLIWNLYDVFYSRLDENNIITWCY